MAEDKIERREYEHKGIPVLIVGDTGTGKSTMFGKDDACGIKGLPADRTIIINTEDQVMPFANEGDFKVVHITSSKGVLSILDRLAGPEGDKYDYVIMDSISATLELVETYTNFAFTNFDVWANYNEITKSIMKKIKALKQQVFITGHPEQKNENFGEIKSYAKIKGRELKYGYIEKQFIIVMYTRPVYDDMTGEVTDINLVYKGNKFNTAKSPTGMFANTVKNDAGHIVKAIRKFYGTSNKKEAINTATK